MAKWQNVNEKLLTIANELRGMADDGCKPADLIRLQKRIERIARHSMLHPGIGEYVPESER